MKARKLLCLLPLCVLLASGCDKDDWDESQLAVQTVEDVKFVYGLLNEAGKPATTFRQGENFSFYFSITNGRNEKMYYLCTTLYYKLGFCGIYSLSEEYFGKSYITGFMTFEGRSVTFEAGEQSICRVPWIYSDDMLELPGEPFANAYQKPLPRGVYYTEFEHEFIFNRNFHDDETMNKESLKVGTLTFRIDFEVK
jgi:hypothetical protein